MNGDEDEGEDRGSEAVLTLAQQADEQDRHRHEPHPGEGRGPDRRQRDAPVAATKRGGRPALSEEEDRVLREPGKISEDVCQTFLGVRFNCNKCHDHPFEKWTQTQYYELGAYFARVNFKKASGTPICAA